MRTIHCSKLNKQAAGLNTLPFPGEFGKKVYENISQEAWQLWLGRQTMLINENRLNLTDPQARAFLMAEAEKFLFTADDSQLPEGYVPPTEKEQI